MTEAEARELARAGGWEDQLRLPTDIKAVQAGFRFEQWRVDHVLAFFERVLRHTKGRFAGQPFVPQPWQIRDIIAPLFGWVDADGRRRFRTGYIEIPKKNGKTTLLAAIALYLLCADGEYGAEVYTAAGSRPQAAQMFRTATAMVRASELKKHARINRSSQVISIEQTESFYTPLAADGELNEGLDAHGMLFDELHVQRTRVLWDSLRYAGAARKQPLFLSITTAGWDRDSICYEQHEYAEQVLAGQRDDLRFLPVVYAASEDDDWTDEAVWHKANPSLGVTIDLASMRADFEEARGNPRKENAFKRYRLNLWTQQEVRWLSMEDWDACAVEVDFASLRGRPCIVGIDLGAGFDVSALVALFLPDDDHPKPLLVTHFWMPEEVARERDEQGSAPWMTWKTQTRQLDLTPGEVTDYTQIRERIKLLHTHARVVETAYDPRDMTQMAIELMQEGIEVVEFRNYMGTMNEPSKELERLLRQGAIEHDGNPVMRWMASNVEIKTDAEGRIRPVKPPHGSGKKIDGIVAAIMAIGRYILRERISSVYDDPEHSIWL